MARVSIATLIAISCLACSGPTLRNGVYSDEQARYRIAVPRGFERVVAGENDLAFHAHDGGTISINSTCIDYEDVPLSALLNHLLFETTERRFLIDEIVTLDGRAARHAALQAELDGVPIELELYVMKKDGCVFDLAHIREPGAPQSARERFRAFVASFALLEVKPHA